MSGDADCWVNCKPTSGNNSFQNTSTDLSGFSEGKSIVRPLTGSPNNSRIVSESGEKGGQILEPLSFDGFGSLFKKTRHLIVNSDSFTQFL